MRLVLFFCVVLGWLWMVQGCDSTKLVCFPAGTQIRTATGSVPIEQLEPGDSVISVDPTTGFLSVSLVVSNKREQCESYLIASTSVGGSFTATEHHPFWSVFDRRFVSVGELDVGDMIAQVTDDTLMQAEIVKIDRIEGALEVYHMSVDRAPYTFVADGHLVHNKPPAPPPLVRMFFVVTPPEAGWIRMNSRDFVGQPPDTAIWVTDGEFISLEAVPRVGWQFERWEGDVAWTDSFWTRTLAGDSLSVRCVFDTLRVRGASAPN